MKACYIGLVILATVGCRAHGTTWEDLSRDAARAGLEASQVEPLLKHCRAHGWNADAAEGAIRYAMDAQQEGVPCNPILDRIEEGVTKNVEPARVAEAAKQRYESLARADQLLHETLGESVQGHGGTVVSLSRALDSGLGKEALAELLRAGGNTRPGPLMAIVDAGELLQHAGFSEADSTAIMHDCLERDLGRQQVMRLIRAACEQKEAGVDTAHIREALSNSRSGGGQGRGQGRNR